VLRESRAICTSRDSALKSIVFKEGSARARASRRANEHEQLSVGAGQLGQVRRGRGDKQADAGAAREGARA
jgi:hypothetical protein